MLAQAALNFDWTIAAMVLGVVASLFAIFFYLRPDGREVQKIAPRHPVSRLTHSPASAYHCCDRDPCARP